MAASPEYKLYRDNKEYVACCKYLEDAAALVSILGDGATIRWHHNKVLWAEGAEEQSAGESYDYAAEIMLARKQAYGG